MNEPCLFYIIGPSGAGKDSLLQAVPRYLPLEVPARIARRYITRPPDAGGEDHIAISEADFRRRAAAGDFLLTWASHGYHYGVGREVEDWLADGCHVLLNGSRAAIERAEQCWGDALVPVVVRVDPGVLAQRLTDRGREDAAALHSRLARGHAIAEPDHRNRVIIDNTGPLVEAARALAQAVVTGGPECDETAHDPGS